MMIMGGSLDNIDELMVWSWRCFLRLFGKTFMIMSSLLQWWWFILDDDLQLKCYYVILLSRWQYDDYDELSWVCWIVRSC